MTIAASLLQELEQEADATRRVSAAYTADLDRGCR